MPYPILPHPVTEFRSVAQAKVGDLYELADGRKYRYVKYEDAVTYAAGQACWWNDHNTYTVTNDESGAEDDNAMAGICPGAPSENDFGLLQTAGLYPSALKLAGDDTIAPGEILIADDFTPTDGTLISLNATASTDGAETIAEMAAVVRKMGNGYCVATDTSVDASDTVDVEIFCESK